jgi:glutamate dehydrogenase
MMPAKQPEQQPAEPLKEAIQQEIALFEKFYLWLEKSMPKVFFAEVSREWIALIVHSLMGFQSQDFFAQIHLKNGALSLCIDHPEADVKILRNYPLYGIKNYTTYVSKKPLPFSQQGHLRIAALQFTKAIEDTQEKLSPEASHELLSFLQARHPDWPEEKIVALIDHMDVKFLRMMPLDRQILALEMFERAQHNDSCQYEVQFDEKWQENNTPSMHVVLAWKNVPKHHFLYRLARVVEHHGLVMRRVNATYIDPYKVDSIFLLSFGLHGAQGKASWEAADIVDFLQEIVTLKYFGSSDVIDTIFVQSGLLSGNLANFLRTSANFIHQVLLHTDPNLYNLENVEEALCRHPELTVKLCEAFGYKFHPRTHDLEKFHTLRKTYVRLVNQIDTGHEYHDQRRKHILLQAMNMIQYTLKTNFYVKNKTALSFRLDPTYLNHTPIDRKKLFPEIPFGIFFIKGMHFIAFHIRFKDLSRGGLRTIYSKRKERMLAERDTIFTECYNLSYTQHKKNKDIPEGGAKGVIFLKPHAHLSAEANILVREMQEAGFEKQAIEQRIHQFTQEQELEYLYQTQRAFIQNLLLLVNCEPDGILRAANIVDYWGKSELIYLGPDENLYDPMIEWIAAESKKVHYQPGGAFISGKPKIGINHKEFGVTSLGVNVYMEEILHALNIDPAVQPFTVKMTGGPDGDVAGNQIMNLYRLYPKTAKLIALTDISGTIYDPLGLDLEVCAHLFATARPIRFYPAEKLHPEGFLLDRENRREAIQYIQQTLCWHNRAGKLEAEWLAGNEMNTLYRNNVHQTKADIFIPCGGRPRTLRPSNYKDFFDKMGEPTAKGIIEGANLYISPDVYPSLEEAGVLLIKDSSANKGGVICSSFEILCSLCLSDDEFLENKPALVGEILERVKRYSLDEARLLINEQRTSGKKWTELSEEISKRIHYFTDQLLAHFDTLELSTSPHDPLIRCFFHFCPSILQEKYQDRLISAITPTHKKAIIASHIASRLVYTRGLSWFPSLIDILPLLLHDPALL